jgi:hypothetical protein
MLKKKLALLTLFGLLLIILAACGDPTPAPTRIELKEALANGQLQAEIFGSGLDVIKLNLALKGRNPLQISVPAGTVFQPQNPKLPSMLVRQGGDVVVTENSGQKTALNLAVASLDMNLTPPSASDTYILSKIQPAPELLKLISLPDFSAEPIAIQQYAIWTITNNPKREAYPAFGSFKNTVAASSADFQRIRALFEKAKIPISNYQALN